MSSVSWMSLLALFFPIAIVAIVFLTPVLIVWLIVRASGDSRTVRAMTAEQEQTLQRVMRGLERMETRIANLETILHDRGRSRQGQTFGGPS